MKHLLALVLMLRVWGWGTPQTDNHNDFVKKFSGVVLVWNDKSVVIRNDDGSLARVNYDDIDGSQWEDVSE